MASPNSSTLQRFTKESPCPNCGGHPRLPRGQGIRCAGYFASNGFFYCSREESAGGAPFNANANAYSHWLEGPCKCGGDHRTSLPALPVAPRTRPASGDNSANAATLYAEAQLAGERAARYLRYRGLSGEVPADWRYVSMLRHPDSAERFPALILPFRRARATAGQPRSCSPWSCAALVGLMDRYLRGSMDPSISLLEIHKLMYFLQEAGQGLKLKYSKALYGPYAENLRHVLNAIEGHLISGYSDGGDAPDKMLEMVPGAVEDAGAYLESHEELRGRFDRVTDLVEGFETPFGLELLATVHWVAAHEDMRTPAEVENATYAWNTRKRRFSPSQIRLALRVLTERGWLAEG